LANLQRVIEAIYIRKKLENQSDWYKNDLLLDQMYELLNKLVEREVTTKLIRVQTLQQEIALANK
jgi:hypothetical protein